MKIVYNPSRSEWPSLIRRPNENQAELEERVRTILNDVCNRGDEALKAYTTSLDGVTLTDFSVSEEEFREANALVPGPLKQAIRAAEKNIRTFHEAQKRAGEKIETMPGVVCWRKGIPVERVGIYIPGGSAPLFSTVLMLGIPAQIAGCSETVLCSPPDKKGKLHPAILYAAGLCGIKTIRKAGGAQAIAAMAYGTASIPACYKIFGPGNRYVTLAKQIVNTQGIAIDMPAGPSEVLVLADESADPSFIAADLLSQAEHGPDSQVLLATTSASLLEKVKQEIEIQLGALPRKDIASKALESSRLLSFDQLEDALDFTNAYAPEHLIINTRTARKLAEKISNAGSVFIGPYSAEAAGDYASGTNHTLPTNGAARAWSGVSVDTFLRQVTFQEITREGLAAIGPTIEIMAEAEELEGHKRAISIRRKKLNL